MSDRDELARDIDPGAYAETIVRDPRSENEATKRKQAAEKTADVLWAAGWRKKPSREAIIEALTPKPEGMVADSETWLSIREKMTAYYERDADAIFALLDGPTETGDSE